MKYITYLNIVAKVIFTVAIFIFVQEESDFYLVPLFTSVGFMVVGVWSLWIIYKEFDIRFRVQNFETLKIYFLDGWDIFISRIFVSLYTTTNTIILGILTTNTIVGYYSIAERIIQAIAGLFIPANQTIYPYMAKLYNESKKIFFDFIARVSYLFLIISIVLFITLFIFSEEVITLVASRNIVNIENIYTILIFTIITNPFGPFFTQVLIIQKLNREFKKIVKYTFLFNIITAPISIYLYEAQGLALIVVLSQMLVIGLCLKEILKVRRKNNYGTR